MQFLLYNLTRNNKGHQLAEASLMPSQWPRYSPNISQVSQVSNHCLTGSVFLFVYIVIMLERYQIFKLPFHLKFSSGLVELNQSRVLSPFPWLLSQCCHLGYSWVVDIEILYLHQNPHPERFSLCQIF